MSETPQPLEGMTRHCVHCGHIWRPRKSLAPKACPQCQSPRWNEPALNASALHGAMPSGSTTIVSNRVVHAVMGLPDLCTAVGEAVAALSYLQQTIDGYRYKVTRALMEVSNVKTGMDALRDETQGLRRASQGTATRLDEPFTQTEARPPAGGPEIPPQAQEPPPNATSGQSRKAPGRPRAAAPEPRRALRIPKSSRSSRRPR